MPDPNEDLSSLTLLGQSGAPAQKRLETFPCPLSEMTGSGPAEIKFEAPEFTSMCPVTNQPDFGSIIITYVPDEKCLESKSLKLYLQTFREEAMFWEKLSTVIMDDVIQALDPRKIVVTVKQHPRGGISLEATSTATK